MKKKVTIISRESNDKTLDIKLLESELLRREIEVNTLTKLLTKDEGIKSLGYLGHMLRQMKAISESRVLVLDTYCIVASMLPHHKRLETIQMWHALGAIKKFGWQTVGKPDGASERVAKLMKMHNGYDHILCSSDVTARFFCEAFNTEINKIVKIGLPRIDYILNDNPVITERVIKKYKDSEKKTILYVPTFHRGSAPDVKGLVEQIDFTKYSLIVKLHPLDEESAEHIHIPGVFYDTYFNSYDLLKIADYVVSDYSSFVIEASLSGKPLFLYTYDIDKYTETTGLNMRFEEEAIGKYVFKDADRLIGALEEEYDYEALNVFKNKYVDVDTMNCTGQLADYIEGLLEK